MKVLSADMYQLSFNQDTQLLTLKAICHFGFKLYCEDNYCSSKTPSSFVGLFTRRTTMREESLINRAEDINIDELNKKCCISLPYGVYYLPFKKNLITMEIKKDGPPLVSEGNLYVNKIVTIQTKHSLDILLEFVKDALIFYRKVVVDNTLDDEKKIVCWLYDDGYWERLNHHSPRDISTVYLEQSKKDKLIHNVRTFMDKKTKEKYGQLGLRYKRNYLFSGYPGTGKSSLAFAIASSFKMSLAIINFGKKLTDAELAKALKTIPSDTILLLEDIDSLFDINRKAEEFKNMITFSGLLNCLDGIFYKDGLITIMTTNFKNKLDCALQRPGRIDYVMDFDYSTKNEIQMMYDKFYPEKIDEFDIFYKKIKYMKLTMATVQEYFLEHMDGCNLVNDVDNLRQRVDALKYDDSTEHLYT